MPPSALSIPPFFENEGVRVRDIASKSTKYHHGDLRNKLIETSTKMMRENGIQCLSLRKLAENAGVSRSAPYHHFKDKNDLLAAVAEQGFENLTYLLQVSAQDESLPLPQRLEQTILNYVRFSVENATQYELMFGSELWRDNPSDRLQRTAKNSFRQYANLIADFHQQGLLKKSDDPLRLAQVMWSTLHGLVTLTHVGIFVRQGDLEDISQYALSKLVQMVE